MSDLLPVIDETKSEPETESEPESFDLSFASSEFLKEFFIRLPKGVILKCRQVCQKWKSIIDERSFWLAKEEYDGESYLKELIDSGKPLLQDNFVHLSIKKPFNRNLLASTNSNGRYAVTRNADPRWSFSHGWNYTSPPIFFTNHDCDSKFHPKFEDLFDGCHETTHFWCTKYLLIHINEIGLTSNIMDNHRPPIIFHEWIAHRADAGCQYRSKIQLFNKHGIEITSAEKQFEFKQWQLQKWEKVEIVMTSYPPGVRRIRITSAGADTQGWAGHYGVKIAGSHFEIKMEEKPPSDALPVKKLK